jgi:hypothetical protein
VILNQDGKTLWHFAKTDFLNRAAQVLDISKKEVDEAIGLFEKTFQQM